ncbi:hypothetical protein JYU34_015909 [Plutella xylostella]|uniref:Uncharacterized protein n=1 Tax=Plutella xylostella TaxID=51655 RepID=A0ABQ7Q5B2_PLUXY|nr:hypothetical protein JYU34_015909 [Plutella xylostella]
MIAAIASAAHCIPPGPRRARLAFTRHDYSHCKQSETLNWSRRDAGRRAAGGGAAGRRAAVRLLPGGEPREL